MSLCVEGQHRACTCLTVVFMPKLKYMFLSLSVMEQLCCNVLEPHQNDIKITATATPTQSGLLG